MGRHRGGYDNAYMLQILSDSHVFGLSRMVATRPENCPPTGTVRSQIPLRLIL